MTSSFDLTGNKILITGAANGLGAVMAQVLSGLGAELAVTDIDGEKLQQVADSIEKSGATKPLVYQQDVCCEEDWERIASDLTTTWGALDGLVNNAGIMPHIPFPNTTLEIFRKTQKINVESVFIGIQTMLPLLKQAGEQGRSASVVNVSSIFGQVAGPLHSAYCASKGAVRLLTKSVATELPRLGYNIRCNSIHPGIMDVGVSMTGMQSLVDLGVFKGVEQAAAHFASLIPQGRPGSAEEIANGVAYLISDASTLMTGSELTLDGGFTAI